MCGENEPKKPRLFYWEEAEDSWIPLPDRLDEIVSSDQLMDGEEFEIKIKRQDMTDEEFENLPDG